MQGDDLFQGGENKCLGDDISHPNQIERFLFFYQIIFPHMFERLRRYFQHQILV